MSKFFSSRHQIFKSSGRCHAYNIFYTLILIQLCTISAETSNLSRIVVSIMLRLCQLSEVITVQYFAWHYPIPISSAALHQCDLYSIPTTWQHLLVTSFAQAAVMFLIFQFICFISSFVYERRGMSVHVVVVFTVNRVVFGRYIFCCYCLKKILEFLLILCLYHRQIRTVQNKLFAVVN